jgi:excisionase family DNA binding protein
MPPTTKLERLYTVSQAADVTGLAQVTIRKRIKAGDIRVVRPLGNRVRIPHSELVRLLGFPQ